MVALCAACASTGAANNDGPLPANPQPTTIAAAATTTTIELGDGARLIVPPGAMQVGATVHAEWKRSSDGWHDMKPSRPGIVLQTDPPDAIHGLLTLEFPAEEADGSSPGIATYDEKSQTWTAVPSQYDSGRRMIVAQIPHFSWWNPFSWDWASIGAAVNQGIGQALGKRSGPAVCNGGTPNWVAQTVGLTNDAAVTVHGCAQAQGDVLDVQLVNNRPYGLMITYGGPVKWGWQEPGKSELDKQRNALINTLVRPNELYLPPGARASIGVLHSAVFEQFCRASDFLAGPVSCGSDHGGT